MHHLLEQALKEGGITLEFSSDDESSSKPKKKLIDSPAKSMSKDRLKNNEFYDNEQSDKDSEYSLKDEMKSKKTPTEGASNQVDDEIDLTKNKKKLKLIDSDGKEVGTKDATKEKESAKKSSIVINAVKKSPQAVNNVNNNKPSGLEKITQSSGGSSKTTGLLETSSNGWTIRSEKSSEERKEKKSMNEIVKKIKTNENGENAIKKIKIIKPDEFERNGNLLLLRLKYQPKRN